MISFYIDFAKVTVASVSFHQIKELNNKKWKNFYSKQFMHL